MEERRGERKGGLTVLREKKPLKIPTNKCRKPLIDTSIHVQEYTHINT